TACGAAPTTPSAPAPPGAAGPGSGPSAPSAPLSSDGVPYPRAIDLTRHDPCQLATPAQLAELKMDRPLAASTAHKIFDGSPACSTRSLQLVTATRWTLTHESMTEFGHKYNIELTKLAPIQGFPTYLGKVKGKTYYCNVEIDTGPGQVLDVQYTLDD